MPTSRYKVFREEIKGLHFLMDAKTADGFTEACRRRGFSKAYFLRGKIEELIKDVFGKKGPPPQIRQKEKDGAKRRGRGQSKRKI